MKTFNPQNEYNLKQDEMFEAKRDTYLGITQKLSSIQEELKNLVKTIKTAQTNEYGLRGDYIPIKPKYDGELYDLKWDTSHLEQIEDLEFFMRGLSRIKEEIMKKYSLTYGSQLYSQVCPDLDD